MKKHTAVRIHSRVKNRVQDSISDCALKPTSLCVAELSTAAVSIAKALLTYLMLSVA